MFWQGSKEREKNKLAVEKRRQEKAVKNTDVDSVDNEFEVVVKATNKDKNIRAAKLKPKVKIAKKKPSKKSTKKKDTILWVLNLRLRTLSQVVLL